MADTNRTFELLERISADILPASGPGRLRMFLDQATGKLTGKDVAGIDHVVSGPTGATGSSGPTGATGATGATGPAGVAAWIHNAPVVFPAPPYPSVPQETVKADPTGGPGNILLPPAPPIVGQQVKVINITVSVNPISVDAQPGEFIDGAPSYVMNTPRERLVVESDGINWIVVG